MQKLSKTLIGLAVIAAIIGIGVAIALFAGKSPNLPKNAQTNDVATTWQVVNTDRVILTARTSNIPSPVAMHPRATAPANSLSENGLITNWEDRVDEILANDTDDTNKVKELFDMFPHVSEDGQTELAQHLSNLVDDEHYAQLGQMLKDARLPEGVLDVLLSDLLNRPNSTKLPLLVEIASNPDHVKAGEAKDLLELYLDEDYGTDWAKWQQKSKEWLKENPD